MSEPSCPLHPVGDGATRQTGTCSGQQQRLSLRKLPLVLGDREQKRNGRGRGIAENSIVRTVLAGSMPRLSQTAPNMRALAWCGRNRPIWPAVISACCNTLCDVLEQHRARPLGEVDPAAKNVGRNHQHCTPLGANETVGEHERIEEARTGARKVDRAGSHKSKSMGEQGGGGQKQDDRVLTLRAE